MVVYGFSFNVTESAFIYACIGILVYGVVEYIQLRNFMKIGVSIVPTKQHYFLKLLFLKKM